MHLLTVYHSLRRRQRQLYGNLAMSGFSDTMGVIQWRTNKQTWATVHGEPASEREPLFDPTNKLFPRPTRDGSSSGHLRRWYLHFAGPHYLARRFLPNENQRARPLEGPIYAFGVPGYNKPLVAITVSWGVERRNNVNWIFNLLLDTLVWTRNSEWRWFKKWKLREIIIRLTCSQFTIFL